VINRIFRGMHTIKGTSSFFGFEKLVELTHHAEDILNQLRKGELAITRAIIDALLRANDQVRLMMADIRNGLPPGGDLAPILEALELCLQGPANLPPAAPAPASDQPGAAADLAADAAEQKAARALAAARPDTSDTMRVEIRKLDYLVNLV